jgi:pseudaminic acid biosynthesis-associated methylase
VIANQFDFVFSKGVLIHLNPDQLKPTYEKMYNWTKKFILIAEYYSPTPQAITYRGNIDRLFKRDFAGEFLDMFPDVTLRDYGFVYHRGTYPQDDITWFLLEKQR